MSNRKRFCDLGGVFCRHAYTMNGEPSCRLIKGTLSGKEVCVRVAYLREKYRVPDWFIENDWQSRVLFMRGTSYEKDGNEIIIGVGGVVFNGKRLETQDEANNALGTLLPEWLIKRLF